MVMANGTNNQLKLTVASDTRKHGAYRYCLLEYPVFDWPAWGMRIYIAEIRIWTN